MAPKLKRMVDRMRRFQVLNSHIFAILSKYLKRTDFEGSNVERAFHRRNIKKTNYQGLPLANGSLSFLRLILGIYASAIQNSLCTPLLLISLTTPTDFTSAVREEISKYEERTRYEEGGE
uniref:Uncharacterized protein n=1 Tax=Glossina palpalis gambiensis TaxID=67801 RepID=A0A1B0BTG9_9MUSC